MATQTHLIYEFDDFQLDADKRKLLLRGEPIALHGKAFELLLALVRNRGELLTKDQLFGMVWPDQIVEESNLTVNMSAIRRALGERASSPHYITTVSGQGYRFTGLVRERSEEKLTIERETFTRVVFEQEEVDEGPNERLVAASSDLPPSISASPSQLQLVSATGAQMRRRKTRILASFTVLLLVIITAGLGYRSWSQNRAASAPSAPFSTKPVSMRRFATHGGVPFRIAISPDGKSIVYRQRINGKDSLWLGQIESDSSVPITKESDIFYQTITFSPDGGNLYLTIRDPKRPQLRLVRMPVIGGVMTDVIENVASPVTFSPDGQRLAFLRSDDERKQTSIIIADTADGKDEHELLTRKWPENFSSEGLSWAPDGKTIAAGAGKADGAHSEILDVSIADGSFKRIDNRDWGFVGNLAWLHDGSGLLVGARENAAARRSQVWFVPYPKGESRKITNDLEVYITEALSLSANGTLAVLQGHLESEIYVATDGDAKRARIALQGVEPRYEGIDGLAWTPDGRLLYTAYVGDGLTIWAMDADGTNLQQLTTNGPNFVDRQMSMTPDGRYIVFQSNRSGPFQIWRANADGSNLKQLTSGDSNVQACVSPDGEWVIYSSEQNGRTTIWRVSIDGGQPTRLTDRSSSWPEVSPDGKYIAYLEGFDSLPGRLAIMPFAGGEPMKTFAVPNTVFLARRMRWTPDSKAIIYKDSIQGLWRQALDGEKSQPVKGFEGVQLSQIAWSLDGRNLAYTRGTAMRDIILLDNFK